MACPRVPPYVIRYLVPVYPVRVACFVRVAGSVTRLHQLQGSCSLPSQVHVQHNRLPPAANTYVPPHSSAQQPTLKPVSAARPQLPPPPPPLPSLPTSASSKANRKKGQNGGGKNQRKVVHSSKTQQQNSARQRRQSVGSNASNSSGNSSNSGVSAAVARDPPTGNKKSTEPTKVCATAVSGRNSGGRDKVKPSAPVGNQNVNNSNKIEPAKDSHLSSGNAGKKGNKKVEKSKPQPKVHSSSTNSAEDPVTREAVTSVAQPVSVIYVPVVNNSSGSDSSSSANSESPGCSKKKKQPPMKKYCNFQQNFPPVAEMTQPCFVVPVVREEAILAKCTKEEAKLFRTLAFYMLPPSVLVFLGYPFECPQFPGLGIYYNCFSNYYTQIPPSSGGNVTPKKTLDEYRNIKHYQEMNGAMYEGEMHSAVYELCYRYVYKELSAIRYDRVRGGTGQPLVQKQCARCGKEFFVTANGEYVTQETCVYHWGKLRKQFNSKDPNMIYMCCNKTCEADGCTTGSLHVYNGSELGLNGPYEGFIKTRPVTDQESFRQRFVFAMDCEMCYTEKGLELAKVTLLSLKGEVIYDAYVKPEGNVIDYNTRFSGITADELNAPGRAKSLREVQTDLLSLITAQTILIGHGLENDLRVLKMIHSRIIDTSVVFPHFRGLPYRQSLKTLASVILKRNIQDSNGHSSVEDAMACIDLILIKARQEFGIQLTDL